MSADTISILHATGNLRMCKRINKDGSIDDYDSAKEFRFETASISSIHDWDQLLRIRLEHDHQACIIRGRYIGDHAASQLEQPKKPGRVLRRKDRFEDQALHMALVEVDSGQTTIDPLTDPEGAAREWIRENLPREFHGVSFVWQSSNSAGIKVGLRMHIWFYLAEARTSAALRAWAMQLKLPLDVSVFDEIQAHYTAAPVFEDSAQNPVKIRSGFHDGLAGEEVVIDIPEEPVAVTHTASTTRGERLRDLAVTDPVAVRLRERGLIKSTQSNGALNIECPRSGHHTGESAESATVYYPPHTGGFVHGAFKCLHAHCADVKTGEFLKELGFVGDPHHPATFDAVGSSVQFIRGTDIEPAPMAWLWPGYLARRKLEIAAGAPGTSKTTIALKLAATVTTGGVWPDGKRASVGNVIIWSGEDSPDDTLIPRVLAMGGDASRVFFVSTVDTGNGDRRPFDPSKDMSVLQATALEIGHVSLVIIDPIVSAIAGDSHKNSETRRGLQPIVDLAENLDAAVLGISHYTKGTQGSNPIERVTGSIAFSAVARIIFGVAKTEDSDDRIFVRAKSNIGPDGGGFKYQVKQVPVPGYPEIHAATIEWGEAIQGSAQSLLKEAETSAAPTKADMALTLIPQYLEDAGGEMLSSALRSQLKEAGIGRNSADKAIKTLGLTRKKPSGPHGELVYALPKPFEFDVTDTDASATTNAIKGAALTSNNSDLFS